MDPTSRTAFLSDLQAAQHAVSFGVTASRASAADTHWRIWSDFCTELALDPLLQDVEDPVTLLQVYLHRYRTGVVAPRGNAVRKRTAEDALRSVGQTFTAMGAPDPRFTPQGQLDFRLARQLRYYEKQDPPPSRVKPVPVTVLLWILHAATLSEHTSTPAIADMIALAFFFLLRPGEYTATPSETTPFRLSDVRLSTGGTYIDIFTAPITTIASATFVSLTFTTQKNGVRGKSLA